MGLEGLKYNCGTSFEMVKNAIKIAGLEHELFEPQSEKGANASYFRASSITVPAGRESEIHILRALGRPSQKKGSTWFYFAEYDIQPTFDLSQLNGSIKFRRGRLIEKTEVFYQE